VHVPDAFTPITVAPISQPTFPFPGTDTKYRMLGNDRDRVVIELEAPAD
jgi:hypothetical protein